jgi:plastocyanin
MRNVVIVVVLVLALGLGYWGTQDRQASAPAPEAESIESAVMPVPSSTVEETQVVNTAPASSATVVTFKDGAFTPKVVKIRVGDTVTWSNKHSANIRVVSNPHPFHTSFPALDSDTLDPGADYSFTFKEKVTVDYHNHFNPGVIGQIVVE